MNLPDFSSNSLDRSIATTRFDPMGFDTPAAPPPPKRLFRPKPLVLPSQRSGSRPLQGAKKASTSDVSLTAEQEIAVRQSVKTARQARDSGAPGFASIQGAAGTGKTTTLKALIQALEDRGFTVGCAALTHKAAAVMGRATTTSAITLAALLGLREQINDDIVDFVPSGKPRLKEADVWLIDEASMTHPKHLEALQKAARSASRDDMVHTFIFIGDSSQLPPVGHKGVSPALLQPIRTELTKVHRHAGPVLRLATEIRCGEALRPPLTESTLGEGSKVIVHPDHASWWQAFLATATDAPEPDHVRVLAFTNHAVAQYNRQARAYFRGADAPPFVAGELVVTNGGVYLQEEVQESPFKANLLYGTSREIRIESAGKTVVSFKGSDRCGDVRDYTDDYGMTREVRFGRNYAFNAWEIKTAVGGHTIYALDTSHKPWFKQWIDWLRDQARIRGDWHDYWLLQRSFATLQPHWALTVHKSQGSQFRHVFVDVANIEGCRKTDLDQKRALLYTAITRAQETVHVIADQPSIVRGWL